MQSGQLRVRGLATTAAVACLALGVSSCGGGAQTKQASEAAHASSTSSSTSAVPAPWRSAQNVLLPSGPSAGQTVASVAGQPISAAEVRDVMVLKSPLGPVPDPPSYSACIADLKVHPEKTAQPVRAPGSPPASAAELRHTCEGRWAEQLVAGFSAVIHQHWLIDEARERGITVSAAEIDHEIRESKKILGSSAKWEAFLKGSGQSHAEIRHASKLNIITSKLFERAAHKVQAPDGAKISHYYAAHKQQFTIPEGRDVRIVRTTTAAAAANVKQELQSGKSFASVAKELSAIGQPLGASNGEVRDLRPGIYQEPALNNGIFSAHQRRLYGPIHIIAPHKTIAGETGDGFFIFEVRHVVPERLTPLAQVRGAIAGQLAKQIRLQTLRSFSKAFKAKWRARTDCRPGYVIVAFCKQYKGTKETEAQEDPYTL
jgi:foldase protein PrsA